MKSPAMGMSVSIVTIVLLAQQGMSALSTSMASVQAAYAGKEPQWLTFESLGKCHDQS